MFGKEEEKLTRESSRRALALSRPLRQALHVTVATALLLASGACVQIPTPKITEDMAKAACQDFNDHFENLSPIFVGSQPVGPDLFPDNPPGVRGHNIVLNREDGSKKPLTDAPYNDERSPVLSPDQQKVVFLRKGTLTRAGWGLLSYASNGDEGIYIVDIEGKDETRITKTPRTAEDEYPNWSPDGKRIAFIRNGATETTWSSDINIVNADGSDLRRIRHIEGKRQENGLGSNFMRSLTYSPDGKYFSYSDWDNLHVIDVNGRRDTLVTNGTFNGIKGFGQQSYWTPDSRHLLIGQWVASKDPKGRAFDGSSRTLLSDLRGRNQIDVSDTCDAYGIRIVMR